MPARKLGVCAIVVASLLIAPPAYGDNFYLGPAQGVNGHSDSEPNFLAIPFSGVPEPPGAYDGFLGTVRASPGPNANLELVQIFVGPGSAPIGASALLTYIDRGPSIDVTSVTPLGPLAPRFNEVRLTSPVLLPAGQGIAIAFQTGGSAPMEFGFFGVPGVTHFFTPNFPGTTGTHPKEFTAENLDVALGVSGNTVSEYAENFFSLSLNRKEPVNRILADVVTSPDFVQAVVTGGYRLPKSAAPPRSSGRAAAAARRQFTLKRKTLTLPPGEAEVRLKWKRNAKTVKRLTQALEDSSKARRKKLVVEAVVTYANGSQETVVEKARLKPPG